MIANLLSVDDLLIVRTITVLLVLVCKMKNKNKSIDLRTLWDRAAKTRKVELGSSSMSQPVILESDAQP